MSTSYSGTHGLQGPTDGIHVPYNWTYTDATERTNATGFISTDVGRLALQLDDYSLWILKDVVPTWGQVTSSTVTTTDKITSTYDPTTYIEFTATGGIKTVVKGVEYSTIE